MQFVALCFRSISQRFSNFSSMNRRLAIAAACSKLGLAWLDLRTGNKTNYKKRQQQQQRLGLLLLPSSNQNRLFLPLAFWELFTLSKVECLSHSWRSKSVSSSMEDLSNLKVSRRFFQFFVLGKVDFFQCHFTYELCTQRSQQPRPNPARSSSERTTKRRGAIWRRISAQGGQNAYNISNKN